VTPSSRALLVATVATGALWILLAVWWTPWDVVPGGVPEPVEAGEVFTAAEIARAESFSRWARVWSWSSLALGLLVIGLIGFTGLGRRVVARLPGPWWLVVPQCVAVVLVVSRLVTLPLGAAMHVHLVRAGLSTQGWGGWLADVARSEGVQVVTGSVLALVVVGCARRWPRWWPAVVGTMVAGLVVVGSFAWPLVVEPMYNDFESLEDGPLRERVLAVADAEGVAVDDVLVSDASRRTSTLNAYVSGLWGSRRVVLYDTLVADVPTDEAVAVAAHELAHARHDDVLTGTALGAVGAAWGVLALALLAGRAPSRWRPGRGMLGDASVVPWLVAVASVGMLLGAPLQSGISRQIEIRADVDALRATGDAAALEDLQVRLALRSLADPTPPAWSHWWWGTHPTVLERVAIARTGGH
jgi:STE24 endopeptidase